MEPTPTDIGMLLNSLIKEVSALRKELKAQKALMNKERRGVFSRGMRQLEPQAITNGKLF